MIPFNYTSSDQDAQAGGFPGATVPQRSAPGGGPAGASLSMGHIRPFGSVTAYLGGQLLEVARPEITYAKKKYYGGIKSDIKEFSRKSRRLLMQYTGKINKSELPLFVTLTYPKEFPEPKKSKEHFRAFWKRVKRRYPKASCIWKLEPQERGAPHYHLLLWGVAEWQAIESVPKMWHEVAGGGDDLHLKWHMGLLGNGNRHCVQRVRSWRGVVSYASKYLGKVIDTCGWESPGRFWGICARECIPWADMVQASLTEKEVFTLFRYLRRVCRIKGRAYRSLALCVGDAAYWYDRLDRLLLR